MKRIVYQIDAFTKSMFSGNPAGVVINAEGMSQFQMQSLARELNNSETAFISRAEASDFDVSIRYFTPSSEVPVCGHATIASGYAILMEGLKYPNPLRIKTGAGILSIELHKDRDSFMISMVQGKVNIAEPFSETLRRKIIEALDLDDEDIDPSCPIQIASTGHSKVIVGIKSKIKLDSLHPRMDTLKSISADVGCNGFYVFTFDSGESDVLVAGRMFAPAIGISEDPVTGNANGPLGAYLVLNRLVKVHQSKFRFIGKQGESMGRKGYVGVNVEVDEAGKPNKVTISGDAVAVFRAEIEI